MRLSSVLVAAFIVIALSLCSHQVSAQEAGHATLAQSSTLPEIIRSGFSYNLHALMFLDVRYPGHSTQNPENAFLGLHRYSEEIHLRPDFFLETPLMSSVFKPRLISYFRQWEDGVMKGETDHHTRAYVNEWLLQLKPHYSFFASFGKEKLLWGPSFLLSPSNILFKDTEKANPKREVEGKHLIKLTGLPSSFLTFTGIYETQNDENAANRPVRALKIDIMGSSFQTSLIGYLQQKDRFRLGSFGQVTASDAIVLYYDGIISRGTDALYPVEDQANPLSGRFIKKHDRSGRIFATVTAGGSYTLLSGETLTAELLYNSTGYNSAEAARYYQIRKSAAGHLVDNDAISGLSRKTLFEAYNAGSSFLRRYYLMFQFQQREIKNVLDLIVRYTHSLDEGSGQLSTILEWRLSDRVQFFNINAVGIGRRDTEFKSILSRSFMIGIELRF